MIRISNSHLCSLRGIRDGRVFRILNRVMIIGVSLLLTSFLFSCATVNSATYESQRRGLLMLEGEQIYKNKGFYHTKKSYKRRKQAIRAHKKSLRR